MVEVTSALTDAVVNYLAKACPGHTASAVTVKLSGGSGKLRVPIMPPSKKDVFMPTPNQQYILEALKGVALRTRALAERSGVEQHNLFVKPRGGIQELRERGLVGHDANVGFYSTAFPPQVLPKD